MLSRSERMVMHLFLFTGLTQEHKSSLQKHKIN